jgi:hypothetical protein
MVVEQFIERPLKAVMLTFEIFGEGFQGEQTIDAIVGRIIHTLSCPSDRKTETESAQQTDCGCKR